MRASRLVIAILALSFLLLFGLATADETGKSESVVPEIKAYRINPDPPKIDGNLDDEIWKSTGIDMARGFKQRVPNDGAAATESTLVAVAYDDDAIYFAFWNYDSEPDKIVRQMVRRDRIGLADNLGIVIDPYHDHQTGYEFVLGSSNVQFDRVYYNDSWGDASWNGVWESAVQTQPWGWSAEVKIPYHCLRFTEKDVHTWGINFNRWIYRKQEDVYWSHWPQSENGVISKSGHLTDLKNIKPARHLEVMPFAVSSTELTPKTLGNDGKDFYSSTGVDIKYGLTSNLTLDATINPDFGQVEMDAPVLNLSAFETYYEELRPFFIEGSTLYETQFSLFYSRRIGRQPRGYAFDDSLLYSEDRPEATSILGAAKLTGKLSSGTSLAFLTAQTAEEKEEIAIGYWDVDTVGVDTSGAPITVSTPVVTGHKEAIIEPEANYSVLRVKQDILKNSYVGAILTNAAQDQRDPVNTGGVDWRLNTNNGTWSTNGQIVYSDIDGEKTGFGFNGEIEKLSGKHWRGAAYFEIMDPYLNLNHLGMNTVNGIREGGVWAQYRTDKPWWIFQQTWNNFNMWGGWIYDGYNYNKGGNINFSFQFVNYMWLNGGVEMQADEYAPWELRGNGIWEWPNNPTYSWWASFNTDSRKKLTLNINPGSGGDREGRWWANYVGFNYKPASNIQVSLGANVHRTIGTTNFVSNVLETGPSGDVVTSVFGTRNQDQFTPSFTFSCVPTPKLSIQFSARTLITSVSHSDFRYYRGGKNYEALPKGSALYNSLSALNNYNYSRINSTLLLRWEYRPGSTLYLVWTRSRPEVDGSVNNLVVSRDLERFFSGNDDNLFLVKISYWWNI